MDACAKEHFDWLLQDQKRMQEMKTWCSPTLQLRSYQKLQYQKLDLWIVPDLASPAQYHDLPVPDAVALAAAVYRVEGVAAAVDAAVAAEAAAVAAAAE